jgi:DNA-binding XRE family transcriptional regulator
MPERELDLTPAKVFCQIENWNNCSCNFRSPDWQHGGMRSTDFARQFGVVVRTRRKAAGLTQEELAERADLASKMVSLIERFERNPSLNVAHSIAHGLGVPLWELIREADNAKRKK